MDLDFLISDTLIGLSHKGYDYCAMSLRPVQKGKTDQ